VAADRYCHRAALDPTGAVLKPDLVDLEPIDTRGQVPKSHRGDPRDHATGSARTARQSGDYD
jgi:hypothetical protein